MVAFTKQQELEVYLQRLYDDPVFFAKELWIDRGLHEKAEIGWVEEEIIRWLAGVDEQGNDLPRRRICIAHRGIGKTFMMSAVVCWILYRDAEEKILIDSKSEGQAKRTLKLITSWIKNVWFIQHLQMSRKMWGQRDNELQYDVGPSSEDRTPSISAMGIDGQLTSSRASRVFSDDVETAKNTKTDAAREDLRDTCREHSAICSYGKRDIVYIGTYHHEQSLYLDLRDRGYVMRCWPFEYPRDDELVHDLAPSLVARLKAGTSVPGDIVVDYRFDNEFRDEQRSEGLLFYAMQYKCLANLADEDRYPLKLEDLIVMPVDRTQAPTHVSWGKMNHNGQSTTCEDISSMGFGRDRLYRPIMWEQVWAPYVGTRMWIDPSGRGADHTGYAIVSQLHGFLWVHEVGGLAGGYDDRTLNTLAVRARFFNVDRIYIEYDMGGGMFQPLFEPVLQRHFLEAGEHDQYPRGWKASTICDVTTSAKRMGGGGFKEERIIRALEAPLAQHRVIVDPKVIAPRAGIPRARELQYQMTRITNQPKCLSHEDKLESLAMCVQTWRDDLVQDPDRQREAHEKKLFDQELEKHYRECGLHVPSKQWHKPRRSAA